jgi:phosphonate transport system permease protein
VSAATGPAARRVAAARDRLPRAFARPPAEAAQRRAIQLGFALAVLFSFWWTGFTFERLWNGLAKLGWLLPFMFPPRHDGWLGEFLWAIGETLAMAFMGTLLASLAALVLGLLGAKNIVTSFVIHFSLRRCLDTIRGIDTLIYALIFVGVVGLGPFAGILAIAVGDAGTLAKLFAEAVENVDRRPVEGVRAAGGGRLAEIRYAILPQVLPVMLSNVLYFFESNTRSATILGIVGAGGIGLQLADRIRINAWDQVAFIVLLILITVYIIDLLSASLRARLIGTARTPA